ncbi:MAG: hypothetical protein AAF449_04430, partial [Myxococcota bacterium]
EPPPPPPPPPPEVEPERDARLNGDHYEVGAKRSEGRASSPASTALLQEEEYDTAPPEPVTATAAQKAAYNPAEDSEFVDGVKQSLTDVAADPTQFQEFAEKVYGPLDTEAVEGLRQDIVAGRWQDILPQTEIVDFGTKGVAGAYAAETEVIYLQDGDVASMRDTYLEELGHHLQKRLSPPGTDVVRDSLGDEGRIFADHFVQDKAGLVKAIDVNAPVARGLRHENDVGQLQVSGPDGAPVLLDVEFNTPAVNADVQQALTTFAPHFQELGTVLDDQQRTNQVLRTIEGLVGDQRTAWQAAAVEAGVPNSQIAGYVDDRYNALVIELEANLTNAGLPGYTFRSGRTGVRLEAPPPPSHGGFGGGPGRADKFEHMDEGWRDNRLLPGSGGLTQVPPGMTLVRHVELDYGAQRTVNPNGRNQNADMGSVTHPSLAPYRDSRGHISANGVRGTETSTTDSHIKHRSTEWLHMSANSDGYGPEALTFHPVPGQEGFGYGEEFNVRTQDPRNLVAGSFGANTMMIALEDAGKEAPNADQFTKTVKAYSSNDNPHDAALIEYTIEHKTSGASKTYYINAQQDSTALLSDFYDMKVDAELFFETAHELPAGNQVYQYMPDDEALRLMSDSASSRLPDEDATPETTKDMRDRVVRRRMEIAGADAALAQPGGKLKAANLNFEALRLEDNPNLQYAIEWYENMHGPVEFEVRNDIEPDVAWDPNSKKIVLNGNSDIFTDPKKMQSLVSLEILNGIAAPRYEAARRNAADMTADEFAREMESIEFEVVRRHNSVFKNDPERNIYGDRFRQFGQQGDEYWDTFDDYYAHQQSITPPGHSQPHTRLYYDQHAAAVAGEPPGLIFVPNRPPAFSTGTVEFEFYDDGRVKGETEFDPNTGEKSAHTTFRQDGTRQTRTEYTSAEPIAVYDESGEVRYEPAGAPLRKAEYHYGQFDGEEVLAFEKHYRNGEAHSGTVYERLTADELGFDAPAGDYLRTTDIDYGDRAQTRTVSVTNADDRLVAQSHYINGKKSVTVYFDDQMRSTQIDRFNDEGALTTRREFSIVDGRSVETANYEYTGSQGQEQVRRKTEFRPDGTKFAAGDWDGEKWNGALAYYDLEGENVVAIHAHDQQGNWQARYDVQTNTIHGIDLDGTLDARTMETFHTLTNGARAEAFEPFFDNERWSPLIDTLDFAAATGLDFEAIENFNLDNPGEFTYNRDHMRAWVNDLSNVDPDLLPPGGADAIRDMKRYIDATDSVGGGIRGFGTMSWLFNNVLGGSASDIVDAGQDIINGGKAFFNVFKNFRNGQNKLFGRTFSEISEEFVTKTLSKLSSFAKIGKVAGPLANLVFLGIDAYTGVKAFQEAKARGASKAELAYHAFSVVGGGLGGGISAAIHARQQGHSRGTAARAFFAGLFGVYDPQNPGGLVESIRRNRADIVGRRESSDTLRDLRLPGFNGEAIWDSKPDDSSWYKNVFSPNLENEFYDYMEANHRDSPNYYPRLEFVNGQYDDGGKWIWYPGQMPLWGARPGHQGDITNIDDLVSVGFT